MKCVKLVGKKNLQLSTIDSPVSKGGSVVVKVKSCGICGSDIHYWDMGVPAGLVMGHEFSGIVVDPGSRFDLKIGDPVTGLPISPCGECAACKSGNSQYCRQTWNEAVGLSLTNPGGYAEFTSCRSDMIRKLPDNVSFDEGCMVEPSAVSLHAINLANVKVGDHVLIIGGGIIGLMAAEFAKKNGASYVALMETNTQRGLKSLSYGMVDDFIDVTKDNAVQEAMKKTKDGYDIVVECCGNSSAVTEAIMTIKPGGKIILVGVSMESITIPTVVAVMGEVCLQGAIAYTPEEFDTVISLIAKQELDVEKYIDAKVSLEEAQTSFERLTSGQDDAVKIIFHPNSDINKE